MESGQEIGAGDVLGRYELLVPIAEGGMASVWAARISESEGVEGIVAVKVMLPELADDPDFEKMFLDEAANASRIKHPNVAEILDVGEHGGQLYQVMEWVDGEPLHHVMRACKGERHLPLPLAVCIGMQTCHALHAAHELCDPDGEPLGLVHRDVSPQNILIGYDGVVKVVDFGVAKATTNSQQTVVGQMKGKAPYMAPEQALSQKVDRRSDVFALGIVLYQLTTGKHPFRGDSDLVTLRRICDRTPAEPPRQVAPDYPPELDDVIVKAISKDPAARFATMDEMRLALSTALAPEEPAGLEEVRAFMRERLGARGQARRKAIEAAMGGEERAGVAPVLPDLPEEGAHAERSDAPPVDEERAPSVDEDRAPSLDEDWAPSGREEPAPWSLPPDVMLFLVLAAMIAAMALWYVLSAR